jgi:hypothetical protein
MTSAQSAGVAQQLEGAEMLHHGSCIGADFEVAVIARKLGMHIESHPANDVPAHKVADAPADIRYPPRRAKARNQEIVNLCDRLVAAPRGPEKSNLRSGTWMTVRMARRAKKPIVLVWPDGTVEEES